MSYAVPPPELEILLPVHNEALSIEATIREIHRSLSGISARFIICEDGSRDNTQDILRNLAAELPLRLNLSRNRKGYSRAVREGMEMMEAEFLLCLDSDGQCVPDDFPKLWELRAQYDVIIGWRVRRADTLARRLMSGLFYLFYQAVFRTPFHDPSCPFVLVWKDVARRLAGELGVMEQGLWWEFNARVHRHGLRVAEVPVGHRERSAGRMQVYSGPRCLASSSGIASPYLPSRARRNAAEPLGLP